MQRFIAIIYIFGFVLGISACSENKNKSKTSATAKATELEGTWETGCIAAGNSHIKETLVFTNDLITDTTLHYSDAACATLLQKTEEIGRFSLGEASKTISGAKELQNTFQSVKWTLFSDADVEFSNQGDAASNQSGPLCEGITDWAKGVEKDILGKKCGWPKVTMGGFYSIYKLDGTKLFVGVQSTAFDGTTTDKRHNQLTSYYFVKKGSGSSTSTTTSTNTDTSLTTSDLTGTWKSSCVSFEDNQRKIVAFIFTDSAVKISLNFFSDTSCQTPLSTIDTTQSYTLGPTISGTTEINYGIETSRSLTASSTYFAQSLNSESYCGFTNWQIGTSVEVLGKTCDGEVLTASPANYSIIKIEGSNLYIGNESESNDGSTPEKRKNEWSSALTKSN